MAAGLVPISIGSDTGGSVRIPAAFNGIVGYKATRGRYPMAGVHPLARSLDSLGVLCRTVEDAAAVDAGLLGRIAPSVVRGTVAGRRLIVPETVVFDDAEPEVVAAFEAALARLEAAGAVIERRPLQLFAEVFALYAEHGPLVTAEAWTVLRRYVESPDAARMDHRVVTRSRLGAGITMPGYAAMLEARERMVATFAETLGDALVVHPTLPHVAPTIASLEADDDLFVKTNAKTLRNTLIGNFLDTCGISLPCGRGAHGMPIGFLVTAPGGRDEDLLSFALAADPLVRAPV